MIYMMQNDKVQKIVEETIKNENITKYNILHWDNVRNLMELAINKAFEEKDKETQEHHKQHIQDIQKFNSYCRIKILSTEQETTQKIIEEVERSIPIRYDEDVGSEQYINKTCWEQLKSRVCSERTTAVSLGVGNSDRRISEKQEPECKACGHKDVESIIRLRIKELEQSIGDIELNRFNEDRKLKAFQRNDLLIDLEGRISELRRLVGDE